MAHSNRELDDVPGHLLRRRAQADGENGAEFEQDSTGDLRLPCGKMLEILARDADGDPVLTCPDRGGAGRIVKEGDLAKDRPLWNFKNQDFPSMRIENHYFNRTGRQNEKGIVTLTLPDDAIALSKMQFLDDRQNFSPGRLGKIRQQRELGRRVCRLA